MSRRIIGVVGPAGSGKSAVAKHLVSKHEFLRMRFAENLKSMLKVGLGLTDEQIDGDQKMISLHQFGGCTPRHLMQTLGTEWGRRMVHSDIWVNAWRQSLPAHGLICVDDVRFPNEASAIRAEGGVLWRVTRTNANAVFVDHPSERLQRDIETDLTLENDRSLFDLMIKVDEEVVRLLS